MDDKIVIVGKEGVTERVAEAAADAAAAATAVVEQAQEMTQEAIDAAAAAQAIAEENAKQLAAAAMETERGIRITNVEREISECRTEIAKLSVGLSEIQSSLTAMASAAQPIVAVTNLTAAKPSSIPAALDPEAPILNPDADAADLPAAEIPAAPQKPVRRKI